MDGVSIFLLFTKLLLLLYRFYLETDRLYINFIYLKQMYFSREKCPGFDILYSFFCFI